MKDISAFPSRIHHRLVISVFSKARDFRSEQQNLPQNGQSNGQHLSITNAKPGEVAIGMELSYGFIALTKVVASHSMFSTV